MAAVAAATGPLVLGGCGDAYIEPGIEDDPGFVPVDCSGGSQRWLDGLTPAKTTEYMELQTPQFLGGAPVVLEATGMRCAGAQDRALCEATFTVLSASRGFPFGFCQDQVCEGLIAATQGDAALLVASHPELVSFLLPVDTTAEAILIMQATGFDVACQRGGAKPSGNGFEVQGFKRPGCDGRTRFVVHVDESGNTDFVDSKIEISPDPNCAVGRRPIGLRAARQRWSARSAAGYFVRAARLEAASIHAFRRLRRELRLHGAPSHLLRAASRAARDEVRHTSLVSDLARGFGGAPERPRVDPMPLRDLESVALENAVEGCVRETFGALVAGWQSRFAASAPVRRVYAQIAEDELRHAGLAWRVAGWADRKLSRSARARVRAAQQDAVATLQAELASEPGAELVSLAGVPGAAQARALAEHVQGALWIRA